MNFRITFLLSVIAIFGHAVYAHTNIAHSHIGVNPTWRCDWTDPANPAGVVDTDPTDDNKLWIFSMPPVHETAPTPGWPDWSDAQGRPFLLLTPLFDSGEPVYKDDGSGKQLWTCEFHYSKANGYGDHEGVDFLDGWHSAEGPQGAWDLDTGNGENYPPDWDIYLVRKSVSVAPEDFFMLTSDDVAVLTADGDSYSMGQDYEEDEGRWGIHAHLAFAFWLAPDFDGEVSVTLYAYDAAEIYERSADFTFRFTTEPCIAPAGDINGDCEVNLQDFAILAKDWLSSGSYHE